MQTTGNHQSAVRTFPPDANERVMSAMRPLYKRWHDTHLIWNDSGWEIASEHEVKSLISDVCYDLFELDPTPNRTGRILKNYQWSSAYAVRPVDNSVDKNMSNINMSTGETYEGVRFANGTLILDEQWNPHRKTTALFVPDGSDGPDRDTFWISHNPYEYVDFEFDNPDQITDLDSSYDAVESRLRKLAPNFIRMLEAVTSYETDPIENRNLRKRYLLMLGQIATRYNVGTNIWAIVSNSPYGVEFTRRICGELAGGDDNVADIAFSKLANDVTIWKLRHKALFDVYDMPNPRNANSRWGSSWWSCRALIGTEILSYKKHQTAPHGNARVNRNLIMARPGKPPCWIGDSSRAGQAKWRLCTMPLGVSSKDPESDFGDEASQAEKVLDQELTHIIPAVVKLFTGIGSMWYEDEEAGIESGHLPSTQSCDDALEFMVGDKEYLDSAMEKPSLEKPLIKRLRQKQQSGCYVPYGLKV